MARDILAKRAQFFWTQSSGATSYKFLWGTSTGTYTNSMSVTDIAQFQASRITPALANGTTYYFVLRAVNINGESSNSSEISILNGAQL